MKPNQIATQGIVLSRTDYGEADRIVTFLTPDYGKAQAIAKGVRKSRSKLAGGVELLSVSELSFLKGKSRLDTLISARLVKFYGNILKQLDRTQWAYEVLKTVNRLTEDAAGPEYFELLQATLASLNNLKLVLPIIEIWFDMQLLRALGNEPNLITDKEGDNLTINTEYSFDLDAMTFFAKKGGGFTSDHIKLLRLSLASDPETLQKISGINELLAPTHNLVQSMRRNTLHI